MRYCVLRGSCDDNSSLRLSSRNLRGTLHLGGICLEDVGDALDLLIRFRPSALLDGFANAGKGLHAVAGVEARRVYLMAIPGTARQALFAGESLLDVHERLIERCRARRRVRRIGE